MSTMRKSTRRVKPAARKRADDFEPVAAAERALGRFVTGPERQAILDAAPAREVAPDDQDVGDPSTWGPEWDNWFWEPNVDEDNESALEDLDVAPLRQLVTITEDAEWFRSPDPSRAARYTVTFQRCGSIVEEQSFDSIADAQLYAAALESRAESDRMWSLVEEQALSGVDYFNQFLDPDDDRDPGEPPPELGITGLWL